MARGSRDEKDKEERGWTIESSTNVLSVGFMLGSRSKFRQIPAMDMRENGKSRAILRNENA